MMAIVPVNQIPTDYEMACDKSLPKIVRSEAWRRYEGRCWLQAYLHRDLRLGQLEFQFQVLVKNHIESGKLLKRIGIK